MLVRVCGGLLCVGVAGLVLGGVGAAAGGVRRGLALLGAAFYLVWGLGVVRFGRSW